MTDQLEPSAPHVSPAATGEPATTAPSIDDAVVVSRRRFTADLLAFWAVVALLIGGLLALAGVVVHRVSITTTDAVAAAPALLAEYHASCPTEAVSRDDAPPLAPPALPVGPDEGVVMGELIIDDLALRWPLVSGVTPSSLAKGAGWYPGTALPGQIGNLAIAGHRITNGEPFRGLLTLKKGARVQVVTCAATYVYEIDVPASELVVDADDSWVLDPLPGRPGERPNTALLTLTANQDLAPTDDRAVAVGHLIETRPAG